MLKKTLVSIAIAASAAGANAAMTLPNTGNGDLFLFVAAVNGNDVATFDLGRTFADSTRGTGFASGNTGTLNAAGTYFVTTYDVSATAAWQSFASAVAAGNRQFGVLGADSAAGAGGAFTSVIFSSSSTLADPGTRSNTAIVSAANTVNGFQQAHNALGTHPTLTAGASYTGAPTTTQAKTVVTSSIGNSSNLNRNPATAFGTNANFFQYNATGNSGLTNNLSAAQFTGLGNIDSFWAMSNTGVLTWNVSAVPEPSDLAMFLAGFGILGAIARRRRV
jgi:PEP-CTERM motif